jgi:prepilin-type processing-associated H-X9-DG protein
MQGQNNLKQLSLAMHNYAATLGGRLPANATYSKDGKPLLSWRVLILPYIEQQQLYQEFHLNEPWDSEHNKKLLAKMPKVYASPEDEKTVQEHVTHYQAFLDKGAFFEGKQGLRFPAEFVDGTSNTIMFVEAAKAVPWSKPEDIPYDPAKPLPKLGLPGARGFNAAMCDGSVRMISHNITQQTLRSAITRNGGEVLGPDF